jgi:4-hydroxybenzoate polyprenyltransferase/phosphoserine phosphatase
MEISTLPRASDFSVSDSFDGAIATDPKLPLCVDLDGTLIKTDVFFESILALLKRSPWAVLALLWWSLRGWSFLKRRVAAEIPLTVETLPYRQEVLQFLRTERDSGRKILLVTAADQAVAEAIGNYLGQFDSVYGSDGVMNLKGSAKAGFLAGMFGTSNFDYIGDSRADLPVWNAARFAYVVGDARIAKRVARNARVAQIFEVSRPSFSAWLRSLRLLHWTKNLLVLLPVLLAHSFSWPAWRDSLIGFALFGASGLYVCNDLLDLHSDRLHPAKSKRAFAAGEFPLWVGAAESASLVGSSLLISFFLNWVFATVLLGYAALTIVYSWKLKKVPLLDVFVLSSFYSIRILSGGIISGTPVSDWLTAFSLFFFLSLAMAKRHSELQCASKLVEDGNSGRGYVVKDRDLLAMFGIASSFAAVVILSLYARSPEVNSLYRSPTELLWLCPLVLYWLTRVWLLAGRGELDHDPVLFAIRDRTSWVLGAVAVIVLAIGGFRSR